VSEDIGTRILGLLDVLSVKLAESRAELRNGIRGLDAKFNKLDAKFAGLDVKVDRLYRRLGRIETRVEGVETERRSFRTEFELRVAPLERST
jgi:hypothetical protein